MIECPKCGNKREPESPDDYDEDTVEETCNSCGSRYEVTGYLSWDWDTELIEDEETSLCETNTEVKE